MNANEVGEKDSPRVIQRGVKIQFNGNQILQVVDREGSMIFGMVVSHCKEMQREEKKKLDKEGGEN